MSVAFNKPKELNAQLFFKALAQFLENEPKDKIKEIKVVNLDQLTVKVYMEELNRISTCNDSILY